jgi:hypothetical protein
MRKALNSNPLAQVAAIGVLGVVVAFLMLRNLSGGEAAPDAERPVGVPAPTEGSATSAAPATDAAVAPADSATATTDAAAVPAEPATGTTEAPTAAFEAGPGLPEPVVAAYERGESVALLVTRAGGVDDKRLRKIAARLNSEQGVAFFHTHARDVAEYSRLAEGVDLDRVPALVVVAPRKVSGNGPPVAAVSYGFRGYDSVRQAVRDAAYKGDERDYHPG